MRKTCSLFMSQRQRFCFSHKPKPPESQSFQNNFYMSLIIYQLENECFIYNNWFLLPDSCFFLNQSPTQESYEHKTTLFSQFSSVTQSCLTLCNPMNHSMPGLPVHHKILGFTQTHVHRVGDAIQPSYPLSSPSPPAPSPSQNQGLFL